MKTQIQRLLFSALTIIIFSACGKSELKPVEFEGSPNLTQCSNPYRPEGSLLLAADKEGRIETLDPYLDSLGEDSWIIDEMKNHIEKRLDGKVVGSANLSWKRTGDSDSFDFKVECNDLQSDGQFGPYPSAQIKFGSDRIVTNSIFNFWIDRSGYSKADPSFWSCGGTESFKSSMKYFAYYGSMQIYRTSQDRIQVLYTNYSDLYNSDSSSKNWEFVLVTYKKE